MTPLTQAQISQAQGQVFANTQGLVFGDGSLTPKLILVGEAPGESEVASLKPFTGRAGVKLDLMLDALGLTRQQVFITMSFHRRPTRVKPNGKLGNRPPTTQELAAEAWLLDAELAAMPKAVPVLLMGNTALKRLSQGTVGEFHGQVRRLLLAGQDQPRMVAVCAHPAALLYRRATQSQTLADLSAIRQTLEEEFSC